MRYMQKGLCKNMDRAIPGLFSHQYSRQDLTFCELLFLKLPLYKLMHIQ